MKNISINEEEKNKFIERVSTQIEVLLDKKLG